MLVIILAGTPGAGKSTYAKSLKSPEVDVVIVSADHFFEKDGQYRFDPKLLGQAHKQCFDNFLFYLDFDTTKRPMIIVVDNTNLAMWEYEKYVKAALDRGCDVEIVNIWCRPEIAAERTLHGVPKEKIYQMYEKFKNGLFEIPLTWKQKDVEKFIP